MDVWDHDGNALAVYQRAGVDPAEPPGPHALARALGIPIRWDAPRQLQAAATCWIRGEPVVFVRRGLPPGYEAWAVYHELAEWYLRGQVDEDKERAADCLAAALRMPRQAFGGLVTAVGPDLPALARPWGASETGAALRYLEVTDRPGVLVTPRSVRLRGAEWGWPPEDELRTLARARSLPSGVERIRIGDRRGAAVLLAA